VAHPNFAERFPGGIIQFAQLAAQLPEDALEDLMIAEANGIGAPNPNLGMPGQLEGEVGVLDFEQDVADQAPIVVGTDGDSSDDEAREVNVFGGRVSGAVLTPHNSRSQ